MSNREQPTSQPSNPKDTSKEKGLQQQNQQKLPQHQGGQRQP
jgi:hypothetical protein